jgi:hypothetical protein
MNITILIQLLLAHILTDFVFQTQKMVESKNKYGLKSTSFHIHILLSGVFTYLILMQWTNWQVPVFIILTHGITDLLKIRLERKRVLFNSQQKNDLNKRSGTVLFFLDQFLHLIVIVIVWLYLIDGYKEVLPLLKMLVAEKQYITIITAVIFIIWPAGLAIGKITEPFRRELSTDDSLCKAGKYIGILERLLALIFVLLGQYAAIGFLIAAKSVLRISKDGEKDARKKTEYVLIGTLISFTTAILIGLLANYIISK